MFGIVFQVKFLQFVRLSDDLTYTLIFIVFFDIQGVFGDFLRKDVVFRVYSSTV